MRDYNKELKISYKILAFGIILDVITTIIGIIIFNLEEGSFLGITNILVLNILVLILIRYFYNRKPKRYTKQISLLILLIGLFRIIIALLNIGLILRILY